MEIMTIHKSKGLEFPIVILAGMGKQFNMQDLNARLLIHPDYGLGADAILPDRRMIVSTLYKQVIRRKLLEETLGEEIRVLYVALTRAKEKLIMTGTIGNLEKRLLSLYRFRENEQELLPAETRLNGKLTGIMCFLRLQGTAAWMNFLRSLDCCHPMIICFMMIRQSFR